jgi:hypothetical protein
VADIIEVVAKFRDEASRELERFGTNLQNIAKMGIEPIAKISPTAGAALEGFVSKLGPTGLAITAIGGAAIGAVGGLTALVKSVADTADEMKDLSQVTGFSTEALSGLGLAAEKSGSSLEGVTGSVKNMQRAIAEATAGSKEANEALAALGVSAEELRSQTPEQQFETLAKAITRIEDPAQRASLAMKIFGKSGTELMPILNTVADEGMGGVIARAEELGVVIGSQTAEQADQFNDALADLMAVGKGLAITLGSALLPLFVDVAKTILEAAVAVTKFLRETGLISGIATAIRVALAPVVEVVRALSTAFISITQALHGDWAAALDTLKMGALRFGDAFAEAMNLGKAASASAAEAVVGHQKQVGAAVRTTGNEAKQAFKDVATGEQELSAAMATVSEKAQAVFAQIAEGAQTAAQARAKAEAEAAGNREQLIQLELSQKVAAIKEEEQKRLDSLKYIGITEAQAAEQRVVIQQASLDAITAANQTAVTEWLALEQHRVEAIREVDAGIQATREQTALELARIDLEGVRNKDEILKLEYQTTVAAIEREREARIAAANQIVGDAALAAKQRFAAEEEALNKIAVAEANLAQQRKQIVQSSSAELIGIIRQLGTAYAEELKPLQLMDVSSNLQKQLGMLDAALASGVLSSNAYVSAVALVKQQADDAANAINYGLQPAVDETSVGMQAVTQDTAAWGMSLQATAGSLATIQAGAETAAASVHSLSAAMAAAGPGPDLQATAEAALAGATATRPYKAPAPGAKTWVPQTMFSHPGENPWASQFYRPSWAYNIGAHGTAWTKMPNVMNPWIGGAWFDISTGMIAPIHEVPKFPGGGIMPGPMGQSALAMLEAGEQVMPIGATGGGGNVTINLNFEREMFVDSDRRMDELARSLWTRIRDVMRRQQI